jgi:polyisoprenyl-phosphate glycosyltransferase
MISVVIPIFNEEEILPVLHDALIAAMRQVNDKWEVIYVNDGSKDSSLELLRELQSIDPHIVVVDLSRNWGHMGAFHAGLLTARGDAIVLMDGDLQDPPNVIPQLVAAWRGGAQVVTAVRTSRQEPLLLTLLFPLFYRILGAISDYPIPLNAGVFGLLDRQAADSMNGLREGNRYLPGLRAWVGFRTATVYYDRQERVGGQGKLTFPSRFKYAVDAITSFSYKPLRLTFVFAALAFVWAVGFEASAFFSQKNAVLYGLSGGFCLMGSFGLLCLGILGEYLGRVYDEVRQRPLSIINRVYHADSAFASAQLSRDSVAHSLKDNDLEKLFPAA